MKGFDDMEDAVMEIAKDGSKGLSWHQGILAKLKRCKIYLKSGFRTHISEKNWVPDHCKHFTNSSIVVDEKGLTKINQPYQKVCTIPQDQIFPKFKELSLLTKEVLLLLLKKGARNNGPKAANASS
jgi:hypothetical protein